MATEKKTGKGRKPRKASPKAQRNRKKKAALVKKVIQNIEQKLEANELKPTVGDFIRLLQLDKELDEEQPREIKVSWVEPDEKGHVSEK